MICVLHQDAAFHRTKAIAINCKPEATSTDFDESGRIYFEVVGHERVLDIIALDRLAGVIVSVHGQTPHKWWGMHVHGAILLGHSADA